MLAENDKWPERVLAQQQNWLGKSKGARIPFSLSSDSFRLPRSEVETFTTRLDTLYGVQYISLSLNHPLVVEYARSSQDLRDFLDRASSLPEDSKEGFLLPSVTAFNPLALLDDAKDFVKDPLPVFVAPYVLGDYGSGAVMGVPAHDTRDFDFWIFNRPENPIKSVIRSSMDDTEPSIMIEPFTQAGYLSSECVPFAGHSTEAAKSSIMDALSAKTSQARHEIRFKLRDWLVSRQRYWGTPIPIVHCDSCGAVPVPAHELPVTLPDLPESYFATSRSNPLASLEPWQNTHCPSCHGPARRDTDTMDTFVDSSWYHLRFANPHNHSLPFSPTAIDTQLPVDLYVGGVEHAILHLLYARFMTKFLSNPSLGLIPPTSALTAANGEPFTRLLSQGMVHGKTYTSPAGKSLNPSTDLDLSDPTKPLIKDTQQAPNVSWEKMSKSKHNGVDPTSCISSYGSDTVRAHMLFLAPVSKVLEWDESRIIGVQRWLGRVWRLVQTHRPSETLSSTTPFTLPRTSENLSSQERRLLNTLDTTVTSLTHALDETFALNTVVSTLMEFTNDISATIGSSSSSTASSTPVISEKVARYVLGELVKLMAPVTPAFAEECWERLHLPLKPPPGGFVPVESVFDVGWPSPVDNSLLSAAEGRGELVKCAVQVNGKLKFTCEVEKEGQKEESHEGESEEEWFKDKIGNCPEGAKWFGRGQRFEMANVKRIVVVGGGRVVNFVF
jgi:leucyl-tRNA synthetase